MSSKAEKKTARLLAMLCERNTFHFSSFENKKTSNVLTTGAGSGGVRGQITASKRDLQLLQLLTDVRKCCKKQHFTFLTFNSVLNFPSIHLVNSCELQEAVCSSSTFFNMYKFDAIAPSVGRKGVLQGWGDLTFHPVRDEFLSLLGGAPGEPVVSEQSRHLVGVHQLPWHEGQRAKRHLFRCNRRGDDQCGWRNEGYGRKVC